MLLHYMHIYKLFLNNTYCTQYINGNTALLHDMTKECVCELLQRRDQDLINFIRNTFVVLIKF